MSNHAEVNNCAHPKPTAESTCIKGGEVIAVDLKCHDCGASWTEARPMSSDSSLESYDVPKPNDFPERKPLLCRIGLHKNRRGFQMIPPYPEQCERCGRFRWVGF